MSNPQPPEVLRHQRHTARRRNRARLLEALEPRALLSATITTYNTPAWDTLQLADLDGQPGQEIVTTTANTTITVTDVRTGAISTFTPETWDSIHFADLDGQPRQRNYAVASSRNQTTSPELAQEIYTVAGSRVTIISPYALATTTIDLGAFTSLEVANLDGQSGHELVAFQNNTVTVLSLTLNSYTSTTPIPSTFSTTLNTFTFPVGSTLGIADLDNRPGNEIFSVNGTTLTALNAGDGTTRTYTIGRWQSFQTADVDGAPGDEFITEWGGRITVNDLRNPANTRTYGLGVRSSLNIAQLDNQPGAEIYVTRGTLVKILSPRTHTTRTYNLGVYDSLQTIDGVGLFVSRPGSVRVVNAVTHKVKAYSVGLFSSIQTVEGPLGTDIFTTKGAKVSVIDPRTQTMKTYNLGLWNSLATANLDGIPGDEIYALRDNLLSVVNLGTGTVQKTLLPFYDATQLTLLASAPSIRILAVRPGTLTLIDAGGAIVDSFTIGTVSTFGVADLAGAGGQQAFFSNGADISVLQIS